MNWDSLMNLNWFSIATATSCYYAMGAFWYSILFGRRWAQWNNINLLDPDAKKGAGGIMRISFVLLLVMVTGLAILISKMQLTEPFSGIKAGLLTGVAFSASSINLSYLFIKKPVGLHFIDGGYHIAGQILAGWIIVIWQ